MPDGEDTTMEGKEMPTVNSAPDEARGKSQPNQLAPRDDAVLSLRQSSNQFGRIAFPIATATRTSTG